jgi:hypothetical protein
MNNTPLLFIFNVNVTIGLLIAVSVLTHVVFNFYKNVSKNKLNSKVSHGNMNFSYYLRAFTSSREEANVAVMDWLRALASNWYTVLGLIIVAFFLCKTQAGIDVVEYLVANRWHDGFGWSYIYYLLMYFVALIWGTVNWITPQYEVDEVGKKIMNDDTVGTANRLAGITSFLILALSLGLVGQDRQNQDYPIYYVILMVIYSILIIIITLNKEDIKNTKTFTWAVLIFFLLIIGWAGFAIYKQFSISAIGRIIGCGFLFEGLLFYILAYTFDTQTFTTSNMLGKKFKRFLQVIFKIFNYLPRLIKNRFDPNGHIMAEYGRFEDLKNPTRYKAAAFCFVYRFVIIMGFITAIAMCFSPNIQPYHPFFALIAGISFFIVIIDLMYYATVKKRIGFLGIFKPIVGNKVTST